MSQFQFSCFELAMQQWAAPSDRPPHAKVRYEYQSENIRDCVIFFGSCFLWVWCLDCTRFELYWNIAVCNGKSPLNRWWDIQSMLLPAGWLRNNLVYYTCQRNRHRTEWQRRRVEDEIEFAFKSTSRLAGCACDGPDVSSTITSEEEKHFQAPRYVKGNSNNNPSRLTSCRFAYRFHCKSISGVCWTSCSIYFFTLFLVRQGTW